MHLSKMLLSGLGVSATVFGLTGSVQAQTYPNPAPLWSAPTDPPLTPTSSLGGPLTLTQTNFFATDPATPLPSATLENTSAKTLGLQLVRHSSRPAAPFVDEPPHPSGGFINVKTD